MPITIATSIAILTAIAGSVYLSDRGLANTMEKLGILLINAAHRMRERQKAVEEKQRQQIAEWGAI